MYPELVESDVVITKARNVHGPVVAEHGIAQILALEASSAMEGSIVICTLPCDTLFPRYQQE
jgi:hypothetical protein